jgi:hypothetical protein
MSTDRSGHLDRLALRLPHQAQAVLTFVFRPEAKWLRIPLGSVLVLAGLLGFLPIFGFWMLPLGALLLAEDFAVVRNLTTHVINAVETWRERRRRNLVDAGE